MPTSYSPRSVSRSPVLRRSPRLAQRKADTMPSPGKAKKAPEPKKSPNVRNFYNRGSVRKPLPDPNRDTLPDTIGFRFPASDVAGSSVTSGSGSSGTSGSRGNTSGLDFNLGQTLSDVQSLKTQIVKLEDVLKQQCPTVASDVFSRPDDSGVADTDEIVVAGPPVSLTRTPSPFPGLVPRRTGSIFGITETPGVSGTPQPGRALPPPRPRNFSFTRREWNRLRRLFLGGDNFLSVQGQRSLTRILEFMDSLYPVPADMVAAYRQADELSPDDFDDLGKNF